AAHADDAGGLHQPGVGARRHGHLAKHQLPVRAAGEGVGVDLAQMPPRLGEAGVGEQVFQAARQGRLAQWCLFGVTAQ
ncbi:hypothetical protein, partial [Aeromonas veronii]|uniref:hypothetical protein n=1 Tax=Aeromonas veronii TaxID=654 RepID=UPI00406D0261